MSLGEKYWLTILLVFCRYFSVMLIIGPAAFIPVGYYINWLWYLGLIIWPLTIMIGIVNMRYLRILTKKFKLGCHQIMEDIK